MLHFFNIRGTPSVPLVRSALTPSAPGLLAQGV